MRDAPGYSQITVRDKVKKQRVNDKTSVAREDIAQEAFKLRGTTERQKQVAQTSENMKSLEFANNQNLFSKSPK